MQKTKRQHYVPQSYLRRFSEDGNSVFVFDKASDSIFQTNTLNIAQERYFFDFHKEATEEDDQFLEHAFSEMETEYANLMGEVLNTLARKHRFNAKQKLKWALFITIQFLRTNEYRQHNAQMRAAELKIINQELTKKGLRFEYGFKEESANHFIMMFNPELLNSLTQVLLSHLWVVWNNKTKQPFYTSDNPVVVSSRLEKSAGFASPGAEVILPLTPSLLLSVCDRRVFSNLAKSDCKAVPLYDLSRVEYYNQLQVVKASRQVYCSASHFDLAKKLCKQDPTLRDPDRERIEVEMSGNIIKFTNK